ncbi:hypothetical protein BGZ83_010713 [Gryganskiella cystojenkinii]|nr:hypothetical protein BGZ83_010713 [Gryganskiella cystojenkinii]
MEAIIEYKCSPLYNIVDIAAFSVPLAGSVNQLLMSAQQNDPETTPQGPHYWIFSISAVIMFFHLLFELRVNELVCKFETIIVNILSSIRVFFFIFAAGLLAFTISFLHLLRGCVQAPCIVPTTLFPQHFFQAFSAVYFFMGGRYDPVGQEMGSENWTFLVLMLVFFFFTVILMLNVTIALLNVAFSQGDETWRLVWLANRLRYCESAETWSWWIPGFRQWYGYFPKYIYYTASPQQVKAFWDRHSGLLEPADQKAVDERASGKPISEQAISYKAKYGAEKENSASGSTNNHMATTGPQAIFSAAVEKALQEFKEQVLRQSQETNERLMQEFKEQMILETRRAVREAMEREG